MSQQPTTAATTRARNVALFIAAGALALTGCAGPAGAEPSGSPAPATSAAATPSSTPTPTPSTTPPYKPASKDGPAENVPVPELPEAAMKETEEGLTAFGEHWLDVLSYAYESGDLKPVQRISGEECLVCEQVKKTVDDWTTDGHWIVGGKAELATSKTTFKKTDNERYQIVLHFVQDELQFYLPDGTLNNSVEKYDSLLMLEASYSDGAWVADLVELMDA